MGIRINKVLGFGLNDVETKDLAIVDPRFNDSFIDSRGRLSLKAFAEWWVKESEGTRANFDAKLFQLNCNNGTINLDKAMWGYVHSETENGFKSVVVFTMPTAQHEWFRHDDSIDYYDVDDMKPQLKVLTRPIWPWDAYWDYSVTPPRRLDGDEHQTWNNRRQAWEEGNIELASFFDGELQEVGLNPNKINPIIPSELVALIKYLKVFKDASTIYSLKPMIYTYWS